jgi:hypothetical protein
VASLCSHLQHCPTIRRSSCINVNIRSKQPLHDLKMAPLDSGLQRRLTTTPHSSSIGGEWLLHDLEVASLGCGLQRRQATILRRSGGIDISVRGEQPFYDLEVASLCSRLQRRPSFLSGSTVG